MALNLAPVVSEYFAAANTNNTDRIAACFATDAKVNDEKRDFVGRDAIRRWASDSRKKYSFQSEPFEVEGPSQAPVVRAHVTGDFPGNPVDLIYRFTLVKDEIATLSIG